MPRVDLEENHCAVTSVQNFDAPITLADQPPTTVQQQQVFMPEYYPPETSDCVVLAQGSIQLPLKKTHDLTRDQPSTSHEEIADILDIPMVKMRLYEFLHHLLCKPRLFRRYIAWTGRGWEFELLRPDRVAMMWARHKGRPTITYDKMTRSLRLYYKDKILVKVNADSKSRFVYRFEQGAGLEHSHGSPEQLFNKLGITFP